MKKTKAAILCALFILSVFAASASAGLMPAPVNPDFNKYIEKPAEVQKQVSGDKELSRTPGKIRHGGTIPEVFDTSHIRVNRNAPYNKANVAALPAQFDLRTNGKVTPVKNQYQYGTCWSFAAFASVESGMIMNNEGTKDLAERHMAYFAYVDESASKPAFTASALPPEWDPVYDQGGNVTMSTALLGRWTGPVDEANCKYEETDPPSASTPRVGQLLHMYRLSNRDINGNTDNTEVKTAVMNGGAVYISLYWDDSHYNEETASYFSSGEITGTGHAVAIVGWDDNFLADNFNEGERPLNNGAWLVKNSWGPEWGKNGYFWLSYYEANISEIAQFRVKPTAANGSYHHQYSYDPLGMVNAGGTGDTTLYLAAVFQTEGNVRDNIPELIKAVGFYATAPDLTYQIKVHTGVTAGVPSSGNLSATVNGSFVYAGYHTIELPQPVRINKGDKFSVIVRVTGTPDYTYMAPLEMYVSGFSEAASANQGETFFSTDGISWTDTWAYDRTTSLCIKAFSDEVMPLKAENLLPANNAEDVPLNVLLKTKGFSVSEGVTHAATQWQIGISDSFENGIVLDTKDDTKNLLEYTVKDGVLDYGTTYYWRARFKGSNGSYSDWSDPTSFVTVKAPAGSSGSGGGGCNAGLPALLIISVPALAVIRRKSKGPDLHI